MNGTNRARTCDPLLVRQVLSQLSYDPIYPYAVLRLTSLSYNGCFSMSSGNILACGRLDLTDICRL